MSSITFTRREMLGAGLGLAGAALAVGTAGLGAVARSAGAPHLVEATYHPLVGHVFKVNSASGTVDLTLVATRNLGPLRYGGTLLTGKQNFALEFKGAPGLDSGTWTLSHPLLGDFALFINPVGRQGSPQRYEAVINTYEINIGRRIDV